MPAYRDPVIQKLIDKLNEDGPAKLKNKYVIADPVVVAKSRLPLVFISRDTTTIGIDTTLEDVHEMPIALNLAYSGADDLNQSGFDAQAGAMALYDLCEGRDANYKIRPDTIAGVLRANEVLDGEHKLYVDIGDNTTTIQYILSPPTRRNMYSVEAVIRTTIKHYELYP